MATEGGRFSWLSSIWKSEESGAASALWTEKSYLKFKLILSGRTLNSHEVFITRLKQRVHLKEVNTEDESDFILVFCPIVSRAGTDIEAAMKRLHNISDTKPVVLVVLHHTFDPECVVPDSIKCVNRKNMIAVDCLFYEDTGLLQCLKNNDSLDKTLRYLEKEQHVKLKKQEQEVRKRTRVNEEKDEERNDTNIKPKKMTLSNETQEGKNTPHERNQQLNKIEVVEEMVKGNKENLECLMEMIIMSEKQKTDLEEKYRHLLGQLEAKNRQLESEVKKLETSKNKLEQELQDKERQLQDTKIVMNQQTSDLAKQNQQIEEKDSLLTERKTQLIERNKELQEKDETIKVLEDSQRHVEEKNTQLENLNKLLKEKESLQTKILEPKGKQLKQEKKTEEEKEEEEEEEEEDTNTGNEKFHKTNPHLELNSKSEEMEHQQVEDITSQQGNENIDMKNNDHLTQEKGTISKATNKFKKNRSSYEGHHQTVLEDTQIRESQPEVEEREIKNVEKNKELIKKNEHQMVQSFELKEKQTVQDVQSYLNNADAMLIDSKEQHKDVTENQQPGLEESNQTEPEEESDNQHEEKDRPQLCKTTTGVYCRRHR